MQAIAALNTALETLIQLRDGELGEGLLSRLPNSIP